jgi:hypothetical protein
MCVMCRKKGMSETAEVYVAVWHFIYVLPRIAHMRIYDNSKHSLAIKL